MHRSGATTRRPARTIRAAVLSCALLTAPMALLAGWGSPAWWAPPLLAVAVGLAELIVLPLQFGRQRLALSATQAALVCALALSAGGWTVPAVLVGMGAAQLLRRQPRLKAGFTLAQSALSTAVAAAVAVAVDGPALLGAAAGMIGYFLVHHTLAGVAVSTMSRRRLRSLWRASAPAAAGNTASSCALGLLAAHLAGPGPLGLLGLAVPVALIWSSYDQQDWRTAERQLFAELARGQEVAMGRPTDISATIVLTAAARLLGGADVEMVLVAADGPVRYAGDENGDPQRLRVDPDAFNEPWVIRALGARGVTTGVAQGRPFCSALLGSYDDPLAVLIARRPRGAAAFGRRERRLAQVLVRQAETWLTPYWLTQADQSRRVVSGPGDASPPTLVAPALTALHDSADRLARLAAAGGELDEVLDELHLVERAVASLVGASALADGVASPAPTPSGVSVPAPRRPAGDWTTTGVLR